MKFVRRKLNVFVAIMAGF